MGLNRFELDVNNVFENDITPKEDEYIKDNIIYCKKCNEPRSLEIETGHYVRCTCKCQQEIYAAKMEKQRFEEEQKHFADLQKISLLDERYKNSYFDSTEKTSESFNNALTRMRNYCKNFEQVNEKGIGVYLFGDSGVGKTHLMSCMIHELIKSNVICLFTNMNEIIKKLKTTFNKNNAETELTYINKLADVPVLFIDDFGTEKVKTNDGSDNWIQEKIYDIVNLRYNKKKPIIFSSNLSLNDLLNENGVMLKTVDRIFEMTVQIKISGESYRLRKKKEDLF